jgi:hypothetical protein
MFVDVSLPATRWQALNALRCFFDFLMMGGLVAWTLRRLPSQKKACRVNAMNQ